MAKKLKSQTKYAFNPHIGIGLPAAEQEENFSKNFIETPALDSLKDVRNSRCIIIGRTGTGKSALIRHISESEPKCRILSPEDMSLRFLTNSTILDYLRTI